MGYEVKGILRKLLSDMNAHRAKHLVLLARLPNGEERIMDVDMYIKTDGELVKVLRGNDLNDLDKLLKDFKEKVTKNDSGDYDMFRLDADPTDEADRMRMFGMVTDADGFASAVNE